MEFTDMPTYLSRRSDSSSCPWSEEEDSILIKTYTTKGLKASISLLPNKSYKQIVRRAKRLGLSSGASFHRKDDSDYKKEAEKLGYTVLGFYTNNYTKILHKHNACGYVWDKIPKDLNKLKGCPNCSIFGFTESSNLLYYIYFPELDLYKVGITNNWDVRKKTFGYTPVLLMSEILASGKAALNKEQELLKAGREAQRCSIKASACNYFLQAR